MNRLLFLLTGLLWVGSAPAIAEEKLEPGDPIAAIDGKPIYLGELNLILTERISVRDLERIPKPVQQATAALLVRRHLAMKSLQQQGGEALAAVIRRRVEAYAAELQRRGTSLAEQAKARMADEQALITDLAWRTAWSEYLKSRLTEANLKKFFDQHADRYAGGRWEVSQIFVKMDTGDAASVAAASERMQELADELRAAGSTAAAFADAAQAHSDAGTAAEGGKVGWVEKDGDLPTAVMAAVRATPPGNLSQPVRSPLGMHLVYVHQAESGKLAFADLTDQTQLRRDAVDALFAALVDQQSDAKVTWFVSALQPPESP